MDSLLKHMVDITGHRDHAMLDVAVISAVHELAAARRTRVLSMVALDAGQAVRQRACIGDEGASAAPTDDVPLAALPDLAACLAQGANSASATGAAGESMLWMPIWMGDKVDTILEIVRDGPFPADMVPMVTGIVGVYRNFQNLLDYSERDSLTGLLNRKTFDDQLAQILQSRGEPEVEKPLPVDEERRHYTDTERQWLAVIDVDHFKLVNDKFGHLYGDEVLILIANQLQSSFRSQDRIFRFGGEEFVVLLRSITLDNAQKIIDRFRTNVEAHDFPQVGRVTVSVGFVSINAYEAPVIILGRADQALYYAKSHGRNLACHYDELVAKGMLTTIASNDTAEFF